MAGNLDKISRSIRAAFINSNLNEALEGIVSKVSKWFKIPMSKKLEKEKAHINVLVNSIISLNENQEARNELIKELQTNYPDFLVILMQKSYE